ncbi:MAG TPA: hypothetical protein VEQ63_08200, partial [Bryobacteraceae bacterium]|nr:hypothetical protein [Bryobacteraceae bacterium]
IRANVPQAESFISEDEVLIYLYTGRHSAILAIPPLNWYHGDPQAFVREYRNLPHFAEQHSLTYAMVTPHDFLRDMDYSTTTMVQKVVASHPNLRAVFSGSGARVYKVSYRSALNAAIPAHFR